MRLVFWGTPEVAVPAFEAFLGDPSVEVVSTVTNPDRPAGRGYTLRPPPVKVAAQAAGVPVWQPQKPTEVLDHLAAARPDACAVVAYGKILPAPVLAEGGNGFVNLHFSLLPRWRGAAPVQHTLLAGDTTTGVTCFLVDEGMDTGPILLTERTEVAEGETAGKLLDRLARLGAPVLLRAVQGLVDGSITPAPQDDTEVTYAPKIDAGDARIDWSADAAAVECAVRAFNPFPGAHTTFDGGRLKVYRARVVDDPGGVGRAEAGGVGLGVPGDVVRVERDGPVVACGSGAVVLEEVQPAGKARMTGAAFANGYRPLGKRLGGD
jgi:methionyl-tRNA formyltransferase